jgi:hypothetical protein
MFQLAARPDRPEKLVGLVSLMLGGINSFNHQTNRLTTPNDIR